MADNIQSIRRNSFVGAFLRLAGMPYYGIQSVNAGVSVHGKDQLHLLYSEFAGPIDIGSIFGLSTIILIDKNGKKIKIAGLNGRKARDFAKHVNTEFCQSIAAQFERAWPEIQEIYNSVKNLSDPSRYPSACLLDPILKKTEERLKTLPSIIPEGVLTAEQKDVLETLVSFQVAPQQVRNSTIDKFIQNELANTQDFLDTIEAKPLTPEQRLAVLTDEDATLVLAGAGSGKTSVIVAKAAYLIKQGIRKPQEILLMAFARDAAAEMASRIEERSGATVDALTFHALGNKIIKEVEGNSVALANHASDESKFRNLLRDILINDVEKDSNLRGILLEWFSEFYWPYKSEWDFQTQDEYFQWVESHELRTLNGDRVKSYEEWEISNWLYRNGIEFEYEPLYGQDLPADARSAYRPDFKLTKSGVYIEHFGVRQSRNPDGTIRLTTAPHIDTERYLDDMAWKRQVHQDNGTTLIETYSYEQVDGCLITSLKEKITPFVEFKPVPEDQIFDTLFEMGMVDGFTQMLCTFLKHYKSSRSSIEKCRLQAENLDDTSRCLAFLKIFEPLYDSYQRHLGEQIDFEDMINLAADLVESGWYLSPYRHLLVDEFQDISEGRARLLRALKAQHADARIFAVGDDWQSIFRFAGSDIHIMRNFGELFGGCFAKEDGIHSIVDLGRTFRSVDKVALPARLFVLKNPLQIQKKVITLTTVDELAIKVSYFDRGREDAALESSLLQISNMNPQGASILLLGRYNFLRPKSLESIQSKFSNLSLRFMTAHSSKGLEADHVIILNVSSGKMGFPSEIVDDPLLNLVLPEPEIFDHAEERRLFYVALTRARKSVTILADRERPSVFVRELVSHPEYETVEVNSQGIAEQRCNSCGGRMLARPSRDGGTYYVCEHRELCGETLPSCSVCKANLPFRSVINPEIFSCNCGAEFPACAGCANGWLVERNGKYGKFIGCVNYPPCKGKQQLPR